MQNCKPINTPIEKGYNLSLDQCPKNDEERKHMVRVPYVSAIGSMIYVMLCTWPYICFVVQLVNRYQSNPYPIHWRAIKRIFCHLQGCRDFVLCYRGGDLRLRGYYNTDWVSDRDECKSTTRYVFDSMVSLLLGGLRSDPALLYPLWSRSKFV